MDRKLILSIFALFILAIPAEATIAKVHIAQHNNCGNTLTCIVTITSTGSGHFAWIMADNYTGTSSNQEISSVTDGASTWVVPAGCAGNDSARGTVSCAYTLALASGKTSVTVTWGTATPGANCDVFFEEASFTGSSIAFDTSGEVTRTASTTPLGVALTIGGANDVISQMAMNQNVAVNSINNSYTDLTGLGSGTVAVLYNSTSGTSPTWSLSGSSTTIMSAIAIKEITASTTASTPPIIR